eukprot:223025-Chlamydomonas_euryale.AAC.3
MEHCSVSTKERTELASITNAWVVRSGSPLMGVGKPKKGLAHRQGEHIMVCSLLQKLCPSVEVVTRQTSLSVCVLKQGKRDTIM